MVYNNSELTKQQMESTNPDINKLFWKYIKDSGPDCDNINKINKIYLKKYGKNIMNQLEREYGKYYTFLESKLDIILKDSYDSKNENFLNFYQHLLSQGEDKFNKILNEKDSTNSNNKYHTIHLDDFDITYKINKIKFDQKSEYQHVQVYDVDNLGNVLVIDNDFQFGETDEHKYHEMIAHTPINYFNKNINILIIGGGDGGVAREALRHNNVNKVTLVELDKLVVDVTKQFFPKLAGVFNHPKLDLHITDGIKYVEEYTGPKFDLIILDLTDFNQSHPLHSIEFYKSLDKVSTNESMFCFNFENFTLDNKYIFDTLSDLKTTFKYIQPYGVYIPSFGGGYYSFCMVSNTINFNSKINWNYYNSKNLDLKYYTPKIHLASYIFPNEIEKEILKIIPKEKINNSIKNNYTHSIIQFENINKNILENSELLNKLINEFIYESSIQYIKMEQNNDTIFIILKNGHLTVNINNQLGIIYIDLLIFEPITLKINKSFNNLLNKLQIHDTNISIIWILS
jgi:spermidine synthase